MTVDVNSGTATWENTNGSSSVTLTVGDKNEYGTEAKTKAGQFNVDKVDITSDGQGGGETPTPAAEETKACVSKRKGRTPSIAALIAMPESPSCSWLSSSSDGLFT